MECRDLQVTVILARDLKDVRRVNTMNPFVVASLSGDERHNNKQRTPVHRGGGTRPRWDYALADPFNVDMAAARDGRLTLNLKIKTKRTGRSDKDVGSVDVPVEELLQQGGDGKPREMSYAVRLPGSGSNGGVLEFSYKFGEASTVHEGKPYQPPADQQPPKAGGSFIRGLMLGSAVSDRMSDLSDTLSDGWDM